jgi:hypothetical protein
LCMNCDVMFGTWGDRRGKGYLVFYDNRECPICLEIKRSVSQARCDHTLCIDCFKRCNFDEEEKEEEENHGIEEEKEEKLDLSKCPLCRI